jgi:hypothetical protein
MFKANACPSGESADFEHSIPFVPWYSRAEHSGSFLGKSFTTPPDLSSGFVVRTRHSRETKGPSSCCPTHFTRFFQKIRRTRFGVRFIHGLKNAGNDSGPIGGGSPPALSVIAPLRLFRGMVPVEQRDFIFRSRLRGDHHHRTQSIGKIWVACEIYASFVLSHLTNAFEPPERV